MSTPVLLLRIKLDNTYGAAFIGALFTVMLYGLTTLQTYFYFGNYPKDGIDVKLQVSLVWILDTVQTILVSLAMYHYLITNYANPFALAVGHWSLNVCFICLEKVSVALNVTIAFFVQCFFTVRIFRLSPPKIKWWLSSVIALVVFGHFCFGIETVVFLKTLTDFQRLLKELQFIAATPFAALAALSDILIAASLCVLLHGSRTGFRSTNAIVTTLIIYAINRCLLTSVVAVAEVIVFAVSPNNLWFLAIDFVIGKLYANSLLATLNSRNAVRTAAGSTAQNVPVSNIGFYDHDGTSEEDSRSVALNIESTRDSEKANTTRNIDVFVSKKQSQQVGV
ncbi:hypothetical protein BDZ94DRAFT_1240102 [Collybia nuda]|uniref:DUF6534 domain-containing protein n=1 Tax=Collybia nuda TaxID=64659 RepID=A0A9P5XWX3_9AGAR|nr:hypothetical protein BDZ94DRAFT_1240102 [Collybia nuda]